MQPCSRGATSPGPTPPESEPVAIVNAAFARRFFGDRSPVGERFRRFGGGDDSPWIRIVGVVGDLRVNPGSENRAGYYVPLAQRRAAGLSLIGFTLAARVGGDPLIAGLLACLVPASRALRVHPVEALRNG